jgi:hypothetical protein
MSIFVLKSILVVLILACGAFFVATGLGVEVPLIKYEGFEAYNIPAGIIILLVGLALAKFWRISTTETSEETTTVTSANGSTTTTQKKILKQTDFMHK